MQTLRSSFAISCFVCSISRACRSPYDIACACCTLPDLNLHVQGWSLKSTKTNCSYFPEAWQLEACHKHRLRKCFCDLPLFRERWFKWSPPKGGEQIGKRDNERYVQYSTVLSSNTLSASAVPKYRTEDETTGAALTGVKLASRARARTVSENSRDA